MSLAVLVVMVVVGIAAIVLAVHLTGGTRDASLHGEDEARRRFAEDFPDERVRAVAITREGADAFLELDGIRTGVVHSIGDRFLTRILTPSDVVRLERRAGRLEIDLRDFTWRRGAFEFADDAVASTVAARLAPALRNDERQTA